MIRRLALLYRKDKALSKAALGLIKVILQLAEISQDGEDKSSSS